MRLLITLLLQKRSSRPGLFILFGEIILFKLASWLSSFPALKLLPRRLSRIMLRIGQALSQYPQMLRTSSLWSIYYRFRQRRQMMFRESCSTSSLVAIWGYFSCRRVRRIFAMNLEVDDTRKTAIKAVMRQPSNSIHNRKRTRTRLYHLGQYLSVEKNNDEVCELRTWPIVRVAATTHSPPHENTPKTAKIYTFKLVINQQ